MPGNSSVKTGHIAKLECAANGYPAPQISWQKDGGNDFPAAQERRMKVMSKDDIFLIVNVKLVDMGIYSCTAKNVAGMIAANATLTILGTIIFFFFFAIFLIFCLLLLLALLSRSYLQNLLGLEVLCSTNKLELVKKLF